MLGETEAMKLVLDNPMAIATRQFNDMLHD